MAKVRAIADIIKSGNYRMTNDTICLSEEGAVLNGQHRLNAIILTGVPVMEVIKYGLPESSFVDMDLGNKRTPSDILACLGVEANRMIIGAALAATAAFLKEDTISGNIYAKLNKRVDELFPLYQKHKAAFDEGATMYSSQTLKRLSSGCYTMLYAIFGSINIDATRTFFEKFNKGTDLAVGDPILALRSQTEQLISKKNAIRNPATVSLSIVAWNSFISGRPLKILRWSKPTCPPITGFDKESFLGGMEL